MCRKNLSIPATADIFETSRVLLIFNDAAIARSFRTRFHNAATAKIAFRRSNASTSNADRGSF